MNQTTIDSFIQEYTDFQNSFRQKATVKIKEVFKQFWEENPDIKVVVWTQYAPYFNDGDACVFRINDPTFSNATDEDDINDLRYGEYNGDNEDIWTAESWDIDKISEKKSGVNGESVKLLCNFLISNAMEDVLKSMFGSDNKIVATREGFAVTDYSESHD